MKTWRQLLVDGLLTVNGLLSSEQFSACTHTKSALVFAPHPDDEVLGCGGVIALKARRGAPVMVVVMTDGRASHKGLIATDELVTMRRAEAEEAAMRLGLTAADYVFLKFEDHRLQEHSAAARARVSDIIDRFKPDEIYVPHRRDGIADHVTTNRIVRGVLDQIDRPVTLLEYPVWLWNSWPWTHGGGRYPAGALKCSLGAIRDLIEIVFACRARVNVSAVSQIKLSALDAYRSQLQRHNGNPRWPILADVAGGDFLRRFMTEFEIFRRTNYSPESQRHTGTSAAP
jgi:LmbE family N-acetylglucosaminyl deacetylase